jgi:hypothetical protein
MAGLVPAMNVFGYVGKGGFPGTRPGKELGRSRSVHLLRTGKNINEINDESSIGTHQGYIFHLAYGGT